MTSYLPPDRLTPIYNSSNFPSSEVSPNLLDVFVAKTGGVFSGLITFNLGLISNNNIQLAGDLVVSDGTYTDTLHQPTLSGNVNINLPTTTGTLALTSDIPSLTNYVTLNTNQSITGTKTFDSNALEITDGFFASNFDQPLLAGNITLSLPTTTGTIALTSDIPSLTNYVTLNTSQTITASKIFPGGVINVTDGSFLADIYPSTMTDDVTLTLPDTTGTLALLSDIPGLNTIQVDDGSAASPSISFNLDTNLGIYRIGNDNLGVTTGGVKRLDLSSTRLDSSVPLYLPDGSVSSPSLTFSSNTNLGIYKHSALNGVDISCGLGADFLSIRGAQTIIPGVTLYNANEGQSIYLNGQDDRIELNTNTVFTTGNIVKSNSILSLSNAAETQYINIDTSTSNIPKITGTSGNNSEVLTVTTYGDLEIEADSDANGAGAIYLKVRGARRMALNSTTLLPITDNAIGLGQLGNRYTAVYAVNGTIQTSDASKKGDITDLSNGLDTINKLKTKTWKWKKDDGSLEETNRYGMMAQDLELDNIDVGFYKEFNEERQEYDYGICYTDYIPYLIKSIQELSARIVDLESR